MIIHMCDWAQQGDIRIKCTQEYTEVGWRKQPDGLPEGVWQAENDMFYTFEDKNVSCEKCKE